MVAEVTGRSRRFVQSRDEEGNYKVVEEKRGKNSSRADAEAFQNDKKKLLVFSGAGGTGYSFHADNTAINQRKRIHYILQPGWRADAAVQGFGRTHRTNQADEPHYVLPTTNLKAQKRFVSSIARRLDQLGALTRGQREATSQGMFTAADNLESEYAKVGLRNFFVDLHRGKTGLDFQDVTKNMGLNLMDENGAFTDSKIPEIPQFLNRLLSLKTDQQNAVFTEFENRLVEAVEYAKQRGIYDEGLQTLKALNIVKTRDDVAYEDQKTGAQTRYVELAVTHEIKYQTWKDVQKYANNRRNEGDLSGWFVSELGKSKGEVFYLSDIGERLDSDGKSVRRGVIQSIKKDGHKYIDNADVVSRGWDYRTVSSNGVNSYQRVTLSRAIDVAEAEKLWNEQIDAAPKTETKTERMLVGVILPIWDRVEGSEFIYRLQTDDGEQLLGRMLGPQSAKQTLKNLGLDSGVSKMSASELFSAIKAGQKAILSNGWEIATSKVNNEDRIELKGRSSLTDAEKRVLKDQGAFVERIQWAERVFIPTGDNGLDVFERITASKPVVDLIEKNASTKVVEEGHDYGLPPETINESAIPLFQEVGNSLHHIDDSRKEVIPMDKKKPFYETVAEKLIEQLKEGTAPWQRPWDSSESGSFMPYNPATDKRYKGVNALHLMSQERDDQRWLTYKQAEAMGAQVRKSEKGTGIQYWKFTDEFVKKDDNGKPVLDAEGNPVKVHVKLERPKVFYATVFNAEQIDGLPPIEKKEQLWNPIERAEGILSASGADIHHNGGSRAFYRPLTDSIHLPDKGQFPNAENYYATALHELGHWTGHSERLGRDLSHPFGSDGYAKEELRAEIASMILGDELNIGHDPSQHAAYVGSWIKALKEDPIEIFRAASDAEKIHDFVLGLEQKQVQEQVVNQEQGIDEALQQTQVNELSKAETAQEKTYINVPFSEKNEAKQLGAKWDRGEQSWYIPADVEQAHFSKWMQASADTLVDTKTANQEDVAQKSAELERDIEARKVIELNNNGLLAVPANALDQATAQDVVREDVAAFSQIVDKAERQLAAIAIGHSADLQAAYQSELQQQAPGIAKEAVAEYSENLLRNRDDHFEEAIMRRDFDVSSTEQLIVNSVRNIEFAQDGIADWRGDFAQENGNANVRIAVDFTEKGALDKAIDTLWKNVELERRYGGEDSNEFRDVISTLEEDWQTWQVHIGVGPAITPEMVNSFNSIPADLSQLSSATADDYEKAAEMARASEDQVKNDPNSTTEDIAAAREKRKTAELTATVNNEDFRQKVAELEQKQETQAAKANESLAQAGQGPGGEKTFINVPFNEKDEAKALGAAWDGGKRSWYIPPNVDQAPFSKWANPQPILAAKKPEVPTSQERQYLAVPYSERKAASALGAKWDGGNKSWYVGPSADISKLQKWLPDNVKSQQDPAMSPRDEFTEALRSVGCIVKGDHPIMDGKKHRIETTGDKAGEKAGFYVVHVDGHPAGFIQNNRTGERLNWKAKGYSLSEGDKAKLQAESATKLQGRQEEEKARHLAVAGAVRQLLAVAPPAPESHQYLQSKQARPGDLTVVPNDAGGLPADSIVLDW